MNRKVIDNQIVRGEKTKNVQISNWISIVILWIGIGISGFNGILGDLKDIVSIFLLIVSTGLIYYNYELGVKVTLGVITLGIVNLIDFFPIKSFISFGIGGIAIGFELILLVVGIIHFLTNRKELTAFIKEIISPDISEKEVKTAQRSKIDGFKRRFSTKQLSELEIISKNSQLLPEAIEAAKELISEKIKN